MKEVYREVGASAMSPHSPVLSCTPPSSRTSPATSWEKTESWKKSVNRLIFGIQTTVAALLTRRQHQVQHLQANLQSRAAMGDSVLETVAAMGAVVDRLYKATSRLSY